MCECAERRPAISIDVSYSITYCYFSKLLAKLTSLEKYQRCQLACAGSLSCVNYMYILLAFLASCRWAFMSG